MKEKSAAVLIYRYPSWSPDIKEQFDISPSDIEKKSSWVEIRKFIKKFK